MAPWFIVCSPLSMQGQGDEVGDFGVSYVIIILKVGPLDKEHQLLN